MILADWIYEDYREMFLPIVAFIGLVVIVILLIKSHKQHKLEGPKKVIGPKRKPFVIGIFLFVGIYYAIIFGFMQHFGFIGPYIEKYNLYMWFMKFFELLVFIPGFIITGVILIKKTDWFSREL